MFFRASVGHTFAAARLAFRRETTTVCGFPRHARLPMRRGAGTSANPNANRSINNHGKSNLRRRDSPILQLKSARNGMFIGLGGVLGK